MHDKIAAMKHDISILLAQLNPVAGDIAGNIGQIQSVQHRADLIVLPEMFVAGYPAEDLVLNAGFMDRVERAVMDFAKGQTGNTAFLLPSPWREDGKIYNTAHLIADGEIKQTRFKHHLPNYGVFDEKRFFSPGPLPAPIPFRGVDLGVMICEDVWFPDVAAHLKRAGAQVLIVPNASPYEDGKMQRRLNAATARVRETGLPLFYLNQVGGQDDLIFDGASFILDAHGDITARGAAFAADLIGNGETRKTIAPYPAPVEATYRAACLGLHDYVRKNGFPGVLIGLSGGVDSALVAAMAVDALGAEAVRCVMMPSAHTSAASLEDAADCAARLGVRLDTVPIGPVIERLEDALRGCTGGDAPLPDITAQNLQSRARGVILMGLSNMGGAMVLSTGNKSEIAVGYATLYGDMCGGYNPLKDIYKTDVYRLCRWRNEGGLVIPDRILTKPPSAELKPGQTDQDSLPPYDVLDDILRALIEGDTTPTGHDPALVARIAGMLRAAEYKRHQSPPGPKTTTRAFARERRYPLTNRG